MTTVILADDLHLERILESTAEMWLPHLNRHAYRQFIAAQMKTAWAVRHQRRYALVDGAELLASAMQYDLTGVMDGLPVRLCGLGTVITEPAHRGAGHARTLVERLLDAATQGGAEAAIMFCDGASAGGSQTGFTMIRPTEVELRVAESARRGAPMTTVRGGEERDLAAIAAMGHIRAAPVRFHLDRNVDFVQYAITKKRLLAGLGTAGAREMHFFIAEEGITAAAYLVISVTGLTWTIEECGDRDPSGARVGALLQALIAREPVERRPTIRAWLPSGFLPPQVTIVSAKPSTEAMTVRTLRPTSTRRPLSADDVLYWRSDLF